MKTLKFFFFAVLAICFAACSNGDGKIVPVSEKINGPLGKFFEVVKRDYKIVDGKLNVEFKRIENGGPKDASWSSNPAFTVELLDKDGDIVASESTDIVFTQEQLEAVFSLSVDESSSITFKLGDVKGASKFKISSKWDESEESEETDEANKSYDLKGAVDKYPITMHLDIEDNVVTGSYYYGKSSTNLLLSGTYDRGDITLHETTAEGRPTGHFSGTLINGVFKGEFVNYNGEHMNFLVSEDGASVDDVLATYEDAEVPDDYDSFPDDDEIISFDDDEGDESVDEFINEYEKFWKRYMDFIKKMDQNDPTVMVEYLQLLDESQKYTRKLSNLQNKMSLKQYNRLNEMNMKLLQEIQKINN